MELPQLSDMLSTEFEMRLTCLQMVNHSTFCLVVEDASGTYKSCEFPMTQSELFDGAAHKRVLDLSKQKGHGRGGLGRSLFKQCACI